jgi:hypothetical protein
MTDLLSSDILEQQFGSTKAEVLYQATDTRIIATHAVDSGQILELSYVVFVQSGIEKFPGTHRAVMAGMSMGKAFRADDIKFILEEQAAYHYVLSLNFKRWFGSSEPATVVRVSILAGSEKRPYADILETYSPEVQWPRLHGKPKADQLDSIQLLDKFLAGQTLI